MQDIFIKNLCRIRDAIIFLGIKHIDCLYSGGGDSGDINEVIIDDTYNLKKTYDFSRNEALMDEAKDINISDLVKTHLVTIFQENPYLKEVHRTETTFDDALRIICQAAIEHFGHSGYGDNAGGSGSFRIRSNGLVTLDHIDYEHACDSLHFFSISSEPLLDEPYSSESQTSRVQKLCEKFEVVEYKKIRFFCEFENKNLINLRIFDYSTNEDLPKELIDEIRADFSSLAIQLFSDIENEFDEDYIEKCEDSGNIYLEALLDVNEKKVSGNFTEPTDEDDEESNYDYEINLDTYFTKKINQIDHDHSDAEENKEEAPGLNRAMRI